ncbi:MAG: HupE/UreJ family protein [Vicinamibacteria bacterium]|nr:HupE/UreJ family protein [Vicinamibacteria bacterium]
MRRLSILLLLAALQAPAARAHVFEFTDTRVTLTGDGRFVALMVADLDALALGVDPTLDPARVAAAIRALPPAEREATAARLQRYFEIRVRVRFDGTPAPFALTFPGAGKRPSPELPEMVFGIVARMEGAVPAGAQQVTFWASRAFPAVRLTLERPGAEAVRHLLPAAEESPAFPVHGTGTIEARAATAWRYALLGFEHILPAGLDHVLFVLGLFLLSPKLKPLLIQVSLFTLAHTATLALSTLGLVRLSPSIVEPLIALSIAWVAFENVLTSELRPWRAGLVFAFGLLHGLGFAGVLGELGLPREAFFSALVAFNVGVEAGQLTVIGLAFAAVGAFRDRPWYRSRVVVPASLLIGSTGAWWTVVRTLGH